MPEMFKYMTLEIIDTAMKFISPFLILFAAILLSYFFRRYYFRLIEKKSADMNSDPTNYKFLGHLVTALIYIIGFSFAIYAVPSLRTLATSMLAGAGILAVAIGFASQQALSNVVSGLFIILFKPFRVNDRLIIRDTLSGVVEDITLRHTVIRNFENRRIVVPNSIISNEILINADLGDEKVCRFLEMGISYDSDVDLAKSIMFDEIKNHKDYYDNRTKEDILNGAPEVLIRVISLGDSSVNLRGYVWALNSGVGFAMYCDLLESVKKRFDKEGIEIPFPHRTIVEKKAKKTKN
jgi:small conductance mechanosensitive channel